jgi:predicted nucleotidyltransferase
MMPKNEFTSILRILRDREIDFIVVGGVALVLAGAPRHTFDLDVVHSRKEENIPRLLAALADLDAYYRIQPERRFRPDESHLTARGHQLLMTRFGPLDLLGNVGNGRTYEDLVDSAPWMDLGEGLLVRVLDIETQITVKQETGRDRDITDVALLRNVLAESRKRQP